MSCPYPRSSTTSDGHAGQHSDAPEECRNSGSRGTVCVNCARTGLWGGRMGNHRLYPAAHLNRGGRRLCTATISKTSLSTQQQNKPLLPPSYTSPPSTLSSSIYSCQTSLPPKLRRGGRWHLPLKPTSRHDSPLPGDPRRIPSPQRSA